MSVGVGVRVGEGEGVGVDVGVGVGVGRCAGGSDVVWCVSLGGWWTGLTHPSPLFLLVSSPHLFSSPLLTTPRISSPLLISSSPLLFSSPLLTTPLLP